MIDIPGLFITGTDTGVGKTFIAAAIARLLHVSGRKVGVLKPVATGATRTESGWEVEDARFLLDAIESTQPIADACPIVFEEPLAPPVAARRAGTLLSFDDIFRATCLSLQRWQNSSNAEVVVVEGVGGLLCPLAEGATVADLAVRLDLPLVIVARAGLGTLNHTLLTVEAALARSLRVAGVILNHGEPASGSVAEATNPEELARRLGSIPILEIVSYTGGRGVVSFDSSGKDWYTRAQRPRLLTSLA